MRFVAPLDKGLHLRSVPLFGDLPAERISLLVEYANEELIPAGAVFQIGDAPVEKIRIIVEGDVSCILPDGKVFQMGPDSVVGVFEFFAGSARATLSAVNDVVALTIPTSAIQEILEDHFDVVVHIFRGLGRTLIRALRSAPSLAGSAAPPNVADGGEPPVLGDVERILALRRTMPFRYASVDGLSTLVKNTKIQRFEKGSVLWEQTDDASWLGVILRGVVECETSLRPGRFYFSENETSAVGFLDTLGDDKRWYQSRALSDVVVLTILKDDLLDTLEDHFDMTVACLTAFAEFGLGIVGRLRDAPGLPPNEVTLTAGATPPEPEASNPLALPAPDSQPPESLR